MDCSKYLNVLSQDSFGGKPQRTCHNGVAKDMYYVVKNVPFVIKVTSADASVSFSECVAEATLFYDTDESKQVETATGAPVSCRIIPTKDDFLCEALQIELNVTVLSSHHQNSPFKIRIVGRTATHTFTIWSFSITSVSKPKQVEKCLSKGAQPTKTRAKRSNSKPIQAPSVASISIPETGSAENVDLATCLKFVMQQLAEAHTKLDFQQQQINTLLQMNQSLLLAQGSEDFRPAKVQKLVADPINLLSSKGLMQPPQQVPSDPNNNVFDSQLEIDELYSDDFSVLGSEGN